MSLPDNDDGIVKLTNHSLTASQYVVVELFMNTSDCIISYLVILKLDNTRAAVRLSSALGMALNRTITGVAPICGQCGTWFSNDFRGCGRLLGGAWRRI